MQRRLKMLSIVLLSGVMQAQVIDYQNTYRVNDLLEEKQITFPLFSDSTENVVWRKTAERKDHYKSLNKPKDT